MLLPAGELHQKIPNPSGKDSFSLESCSMQHPAVWSCCCEGSIWTTVPLLRYSPTLEDNLLFWTAKPLTRKEALKFKRVAATVFKNSNFVFLFCALHHVVYVRKFETKPELKGENCCLLVYFLFFWKPECTMLWVNWMLMWIFMGRIFVHCYYVISTFCVCSHCGLVS